MAAILSQITKERENCLVPKNRDTLTNGLKYLSLRAPKGCVAIEKQTGEIASLHSQ